MFGSVFKRLHGRHYRKFIKKCEPIVRKINQFEEEYQSLSDEALVQKTQAFMERNQKGESLEVLLPEAFAVVKNAARRLCGKTFDVCGQDMTWNMVHFDVQLIGGMALHEHKIAEMQTGEGKTLVATLPLYLNALSGRNCQLVTVNDYLARRDSEWMGNLFRFLGLTVGCIQNNMSPAERREAYGCNITYGTASEFGFDYLRDNGMATRKEDQVQRDHYFVIIDEADSILIDEARTPLIISGPAQEDKPLPFKEFKPGIQRLFNEQVRLCNNLAQEAKEALEADSAEKNREAAYKLMQVKQGMPKNKQLLRLMENGTYRKLLDKFEAEMQSEFNKEKLYEIKEGLFFEIDEKQHHADLTEKGRQLLRPDDPDGFMLPDLPSIFMEIDKQVDLSDQQKQAKKQEAEERFGKVSEEIHCISQLLRAYSLYEKDVEYVVQEGKVHIVDENTGRLMPGRRWSEGLHAAVEAKEGVAIEKETKTYATITIQNYFRMYDKLAGMTGTAETEATEFYEIYKLSVVVIPTHRPCVREDLNDVIYKTRREKYNAVIADIEEAHKAGRPILVGTTSVDASELLSRMLKRTKIPHTVLNAKLHQQEAEVVARAGHKGAVTIATNMAGRGTDIKLGEGVPELGGLLVLGTERHESRRIDRQLRGRCARQGDPGASKFYISLEDDLMRLFANAGPISRILEKSFEEGQSLEHPLLNRSIESAQKKVEQQNFSIRKRLLEYDDVLNRQREVIYGLRNDAIHSEVPSEILLEVVEEGLGDRVDELVGKGPVLTETNTGTSGFLHWLKSHFPINVSEADLVGKNADSILAFLMEQTRVAYEKRQELEDAEALKGLARYVIIRSIDRNWQDHLTEIEELRRSVGLRSYGQKDPLSEYKSEAFIYFEEMMRNVRSAAATHIFRSATNLDAFNNMLKQLQRNAQVSGPDQDETLATLMARQAAPAAQPVGAGEGQAQVAELPKVTVRREEPKVGRNDLCPCGSGKKYKKCCGAN